LALLVGVAVMTVATSLFLLVLGHHESSRSGGDHAGSASGGVARSPGRSVVPDRDGSAGVARSVAAALFSYDTRTSQAEWRQSVLRVASIADGSPAAQDIDALIPNGPQWAQMAAVGQRATFAVSEVHVPDLWRQTVAEHPELPPGAVGLTVNGTQRVVWEGGSSQASLSVTLLLLCPPTTERCAVSRVPVQAAP
jgi:hypothetical protein